jgi:endonuclease/exonuclease/phosphatase family metal-dependent hydrolase
LRRIAVVLALLAGCGGGGAPAGHDVTAVVFNLCGNVCAEGGDRALPFVTELVEDSGADVVLLQEVCHSQASHLADALGWEVHHVTTFKGDLNGANRCVDDDYGMAIVGPDPNGRTTIPLPTPGLGATQIDVRSIICATVDDLTACTTHLVRKKNDADAHRLQIAAFVQAASDLAATKVPVLLAGDLNDDVDAFGDLERDYVSSGERDSLDHVFATARDFSAIDVAERDCTCSDHPALVVTARGI